MSECAAPLHIGRNEDFERLRALLDEAGFAETSVCRILGIEAISEVGRADPASVRFSPVQPPVLGLLIRVFLLLESVPVDEVEQRIDPLTLKSLLELDVLRNDVARGRERYHASVLVAPVSGFYVASDRHTEPDGSLRPPFSDVVFPALWVGTLRFLRAIPKSRAHAGLDLCSGSGVAGLMLSKCTERVAACDITARAVHFADFNRRLNRCVNVEALEGDLYGAVEGRVFDRIVAHPPYMPSLSSTMTFRDGGETGEAIIQRIVESLPRYLEPGGMFCAVTAGADVTAAPFERRVREWLGDFHHEFDIVFAQSSELSSERLTTQLVNRSPDAAPSERSRWQDIFRRTGMQQLVYGALVINRRRQRESDIPDTAEPWTTRVQMSAATDGSCFEWAFRWHDWYRRKSAAGQVVATLESVTPCLAPDLRVRVTHVVRDKSLAPEDFVLETERPFFAETRIEPWMASLLALCDGAATTSEVYDRAREAGVIPRSFALSDFVTLLAKMIERGYVVVPDSIFEG